MSDRETKDRNDPAPLMPQPSPSQSPSRQPRSELFANPQVYIIGVCLLIFVLLIILAAHNQQHLTIPRPVRPPLPQHNGFDALKAASEKVQRDDDLFDATVPHASVRPSKRKWSLSEKKKLLVDNRIAWQTAQDSLSLPYQEENDANVFSDQLPRYQKLRHLAKVLILAGDIAFAEKRQRVAVDDYLNAVKLGRSIPHRSRIDGREAGIVCEIFGRIALWQTLNRMDADTAQYCLQHMEALQAYRLPLAVTLEEEKYSVQSTTLTLLTDQENNSFYRVYTMVVSRKAVIRHLGDYMDQAIRQSNQPYPIGKQPISKPQDLI